MVASRALEVLPNLPQLTKELEGQKLAPSYKTHSVIKDQLRDKLLPAIISPPLTLNDQIQTIQEIQHTKALSKIVEKLSENCAGCRKWGGGGVTRNRPNTQHGKPTTSVTSITRVLLEWKQWGVSRI